MNYPARPRPFFVLLTLSTFFIGCENGTLTSSNRKVNDRELSRRMRDASMEQVGRITVNGTVVDGYTIAIQGDSLEWYEASNQQGKRHTAEVHDIGAVVIDHPHENGVLICTGAGLGGGLLLGSYIEMNSMAKAGQNGNTRTFNWNTPLIAGGIGTGLGLVAGLFLD